MRVWGLLLFRTSPTCVRVLSLLSPSEHVRCVSRLSVSVPSRSCSFELSTNALLRSCQCRQVAFWVGEATCVLGNEKMWVPSVLLSVRGCGAETPQACGGWEGRNYCPPNQL